MTTPITVPVFPESVTDGTLVNWHKKPGDAVKRDDTLAEIETDKVVFEVPAPEDGVLMKIIEQTGATVLSGQVIAQFQAGAVSTTKEETAAPSKPANRKSTGHKPADETVLSSPSARKLMREHGLSTRDVRGSNNDGRIGKDDVLAAISRHSTSAVPKLEPVAETVTTPNMNVVQLGDRPQKRVPMSRLRKRVAERLVEAQHNAAMLSTFNEINMHPILELRKRYKDKFEKTHGVRLGLMSFFVKAVVEALKRYPQVNASIDGEDVVYHGFFDVGIAVGSPRGLVVPILKDAEKMDMADIELNIKDFGQRAQSGSLSLEEISGGTFTITNGGVFGSLLSTPILNPPQSGILGMHTIQERPVAEDGKVVIRPMMYVALSYDHRIIDGQEAVQFLVNIKELLEEPARLLLEI
ncbi:MAG: 2-oxoglutarate dehydrogenase complex dihydrolipoyllysine-residue succinyltransferase [Proteobacteria bacterium]|nr:2-oxoglutarate dehydrogenase complex dihydrolipoyllysine-residue succinyltransferase [Pseudomonadota bacterium]